MNREMLEPTPDSEVTEAVNQDVEILDRPEQDVTADERVIETTESQADKAELIYRAEISDIHAISNFLENLSNQFSPEEAISLLTSYFLQKQQRSEMFSFENPVKLAKEVWSIETRIRSIDVPSDKKEAISSIREGLLASILSGKISAQAVLSRLNGDIIISDSPGEETKDYEVDTKLAAFYTIDNGRSNIYLYESFFSQGERLQQHHLNHELGHLFAESGAIWEQRVFIEFLEAVGNKDDAKINSLAAEAPELVAVYQIINNPHEAIFFRPYIKSRLAKALESGNPDDRIIAAREMIAEIIGFYLESANSEISFFNARLELSGMDAYEMCRTLLPPAKFDQLTEQYDLEGKSLTVEDAFEILRDLPEFEAEFKMQKFFLERLASSFENRGANIKPMEESMNVDRSVEYADEEFGDYDNLYQNHSGSAISGGDHDTSASSGRQAENPFNTIWEFVTGGKKLI